MKPYYIGLMAIAICDLAGCDKTPTESPSVITSSQAEAPDPEAFLTRLYTHYSGHPADTSFSPISAPSSQWFDREMAALIAEDTRLADGEIGALDSDPVCDCQDFGTLSANIKIEQATATTARASVILTEMDSTFNSEARQPRMLTYDLVMEDGHWRIHDIGTKAIPSLHDWIARSNAALSSR